MEQSEMENTHLQKLIVILSVIEHGHHLDGWLSIMC